MFLFVDFGFLETNILAKRKKYGWLNFIQYILTFLQLYITMLFLSSHPNATINPSDFCLPASIKKKKKVLFLLTTHQQQKFANVKWDFCSILFSRPTNQLIRLLWIAGSFYFLYVQILKGWQHLRKHFFFFFLVVDQHYPNSGYFWGISFGIYIYPSSFTYMFFFFYLDINTILSNQIFIQWVMKWNWGGCVQFFFFVPPPQPVT